jgi:hypothetical protein
LLLRPGIDLCRWTQCSKSRSHAQKRMAEGSRIGRRLPGIHQLFRSRLANESAYRRAPDLWSHGHQEPEGRPEDGPRHGWTRSAKGPFADRPRPSSATGNSSADHSASDAPKYVASIEGHHLYLHGRRLHPAQPWPYPILVQTPCRTCSFLEHDGSGTAQCVAVWKLKAVIHGIDGGENRLRPGSPRAPVDPVSARVEHVDGGRVA